MTSNARVRPASPLGVFGVLKRIGITTGMCVSVVWLIISFGDGRPADLRPRSSAVVRSITVPNGSFASRETTRSGDGSGFVSLNSAQRYPSLVGWRDITIVGCGSVLSSSATHLARVSHNVAAAKYAATIPARAAIAVRALIGTRRKVSTARQTRESPAQPCHANAMARLLNASRVTPWWIP